MASKKTIKVKLFDKSLPMPEYKTRHAVAYDLYLRKTTEVVPGKVVLAPLNVAVELPRGHLAILAARSSLFKLGVMAANGIGVIDEDYRGDEDEYMLPLLNFTKKKVLLKRGERIAQVIVLKYQRVKFRKVEKLANKSRGGFGSTGRK